VRLRVYCRDFTSHGRRVFPLHPKSGAKNEFASHPQVMLWCNWQSPEYMAFPVVTTTLSPMTVPKKTIKKLQFYKYCTHCISPHFERAISIKFLCWHIPFCLWIKIDRSFDPFEKSDPFVATKKKMILTAVLKAAPDRKLETNRVHSDYVIYQVCKLISLL
jgi:hypothetical protein